MQVNTLQVKSHKAKTTMPLYSPNVKAGKLLIVGYSQLSPPNCLFSIPVTVADETAGTLQPQCSSAITSPEEPLQSEVKTLKNRYDEQTDHYCSLLSKGCPLCRVITHVGHQTQGLMFDTVIRPLARRNRLIDLKVCACVFVPVYVCVLVCRIYLCMCWGREVGTVTENITLEKKCYFEGKGGRTIRARGKGRQY